MDDVDVEVKERIKKSRSPRNFSMSAKAEGRASVRLCTLNDATQPRSLNFYIHPTVVAIQVVNFAITSPSNDPHLPFRHPITH